MPPPSTCTSTRPARRASRRTRECSAIRAPRRSAAVASPQASFAGLTNTHRSGPPRTPAWKRGEWTRAWIASRSRNVSSMPCSAARSTYSCSPSTCHGSAATSKVPVSSSSASMPSLRTNATSSAQVAQALRLEPLELVGEVEEPVVEAVGERRRAEAAVATAGALRDPIGLEHDDAQRRVRLEQADRRPQPGEPAADDRDIDRRPTVEGRPGRPRIAVQVPERAARRRRRASSRPGQGERPARPAELVHHVRNVRGSGRPAPSLVRDSHARPLSGTKFVLTLVEAVWHDRPHLLHIPQRLSRITVQSPRGAPPVAPTSDDAARPGPRGRSLEAP